MPEVEGRLEEMAVRLALLRRMPVKKNHEIHISEAEQRRIEEAVLYLQKEFGLPELQAEE